MTDTATNELHKFVSENGHVPLTWAAVRGGLNYTNFGDALSPIIVAAMSGFPIHKYAFDSQKTRIGAIGTIGHNFRNGKIHVWGTGFDEKINIVDRNVGFYQLPPQTQLIVHATRGRKSAELLRSKGISVAPSYGDPGWFSPRIFPFPDIEKKYDLGVIIHLSELQQQVPGSSVKPELLRYKIPSTLTSSIRIIDTFATDRSVAGIQSKIKEMVECKRIVSTSLHGLVIAETYNIPCAWFGLVGDGLGMVLGVDDTNARIDHRVRDFYSGVGRTNVHAYMQPRNIETDWENLLNFVDSAWAPLDYDGRGLFDSFPLPKAVSFSDDFWNADISSLLNIDI